MKHIVLFKASLSSGGAEHQLCYLANGLAERGYQVTVITFADMPDFYQLDRKIERIRLAEGKSRLIKGVSLFAYFLNIQCDVIICFGQRESYLCMKNLKCRSHIKVIAGERNLTYGQPSKYEVALLSKYYKKATWIVSNSYSQMEHLKKVSPNLTDKLRTIINYTEIDKFRITPLPNGDILQIAVFARFDKQKNYSRFAKALSLGKQILADKLRIVWYGNVKSSSGQLNSDYLLFCDLIEKYGISNIIKLSNHVKDVPSEMRKYDAICLPSLFEGFSNSIAEAISCGKPMLVSDVSDNKIMVHHGVNGFIFDPLKEESILDGLSAYLNLSQEARNKMSIESRRIAEDLFSNTKFINSYIKLIES